MTQTQSKETSSNHDQKILLTIPDDLIEQAAAIETDIRYELELILRHYRDQRVCTQIANAVLTDDEAMSKWLRSIKRRPDSSPLNDPWLIKSQPFVRAITYKNRKVSTQISVETSVLDVAPNRFSGPQRPVWMLGSIHSLWNGTDRERGRHQVAKFWFRWRRRYKYTCLDYREHLHNCRQFEDRIQKKRYGPDFWGRKNLFDLDRYRVSVQDPTNGYYHRRGKDNPYVEYYEDYRFWINGQYFTLKSYDKNYQHNNKTIMQRNNAKIAVLLEINAGVKKLTSNR